MGYNIHITRAKTPWEDGLIAQEEWLECVKNDPELEVSTTDYGVKRVGTKYIKEYDIIWTKGTMEESSGPPLWYGNGRVFTKNAGDAFIEKMKSIAQTLNAQVLGDDGEEY